MAKAEEVAKENSATKITLQVKEINQIAAKTYTSNGYSELGQRKLIPFPFLKTLVTLFSWKKFISLAHSKNVIFSLTCAPVHIFSLM